MTACSSHPGTIKGAELQKLVAASEVLQRRLDERINVIASRYGIDKASFELLDRLVNDEGRTEERGLGLLRSAGLVTGEAPSTLVTTEGLKAYAAINQARFDWLDEAAESIDTAAVRAATELLKNLRL